MISEILVGKIIAEKPEMSGKVFVDTLPADVNIGVGLFDPLDGVGVSHHMPGHYNTTIKAIVRHTDPVAGKQLAMEVNKILTVEAPEAHGDEVLKLLLQKTLPVKFPSLEGNTIEFATIFNLSFSIGDL